MDAPGNTVVRKGPEPKQIDKDEFEKLCALHCTMEEIASFFKMSTETLSFRVKDMYDGRTFGEVYKEFKQHGKISLRRAMYMRAVKDKSDKMLVWISKNWLGWSDKTVNFEMQLQKPAIIELLDGSQIVLGKEPIKDVNEIKEENLNDNSGSGIEP